jgi:hypothetical protein
LLEPPSGGTFNPYVSDPAREGTCQHCHRRIDPAAIHFKRYGKQVGSFEGFGARTWIPGVGAFQVPTAWSTGTYPFHDEPFSQWRRWFTPNTALTPITTDEAAAFVDAHFIDFLPPDQTLLGQTSDGTVGPLGFAKLIVEAGAFDRCVVRQVHKYVLGRDVDVATEAGYLDALVDDFVSDNRTVRGLVDRLIHSAPFERGL